MKKVVVTFFTVAILSATSAFAQSSPFSYSYIQAGYGSGTVDVAGVSLNTSGTSLAASVATSEATFITGSFGNGTVKVGGISANLDDWSIGFGGRMPLSTATDLVGSVSYLSTTLSANGGWIKETGLGLNAGVRHALGEMLELGAGAGLAITGSERVQTTSFNFGGRFKVSNGFSIGGGYSVARNDTATSSGFGINGRLEF